VRWRTVQDEQEPVGAESGGGRVGVGESRISGCHTVGRRQAAFQAQACGTRAVVGWPSTAQSAHFAPPGHVDGHARLQPTVLTAPIPAQQFWPVDVQQQQ